MDTVFKNQYLKDRTKTASDRNTIQAKVDADLTPLNAAVAELNRVVRMLMNSAYTAGGLAAGTNVHTVKTANTVTYISDGVFKSKGATDNIEIPASSVVPVSSFCKFLVSLNAAGTPTITKGNNGASAGAALLPAVPAGETPIGYMQVATDGATTYTPGTTDDPTAGITFTYVDISWPNSGTDDIVGALASMSAAIGALSAYTKF